jgi:nitrite reductase/ring-hydroxylating ferredoxin subunit/DMSO/TMAO reductase YedYZ heme-binding membrane subunit
MSPRFLPLLSNRRHLGVVTFLVAVTHAVAAVGYYHGFRRRNPLISLLATNVNYGSWIGFPFEVLGLAALAVLFLMAATSHNFWQKNLTPGVWKALHMLVYPAYALLVMHVTLGALQRTISLLPAVVLAVGASLVVALHLVAGVRERWRDLQGFRIGADVRGLPWLDVGCVDDIPNNRGKVVCVSGQERIAVFRYDSKVSAVTNVCAHQQGPLGEGVIQGGCITCPWHGWEYTPQDGRSPPPYTEKISTYPVRVENGRILVYPEALPPGTFTEPAHVDD